MSDNNVTHIKEERDQKFLRNIQDPTITWTFQLSGNRKVTGGVVGFLWTSEGIPITLSVQPDNGEVVEIPWPAIQLISYVKGF
jgi:hypothetical protein